MRVARSISAGDCTAFLLWVVGLDFGLDFDWLGCCRRNWLMGTPSEYCLTFEILPVMLRLLAGRHANIALHNGLPPSATSGPSPASSKSERRWRVTSGRDAIIDGLGAAESCTRSRSFRVYFDPRALSQHRTIPHCA